MKLIDLLVQELPKRGGWPSGVAYISSHADGHFYRDGGRWHAAFAGAICSDGWRFGMPSTYTNKVTREQYEAALAETMQIDMDGEELPGVGVRVEWLSEQHGWIGGTVAAHDAKYPHVAIIRHNDGYTGCHRHQIRTKSERRREDLKSAIAELCRQSASNGHSADLIYDAIAAGKIPGVKLED